MTCEGNIIYHSQPMYDDYRDEDWYSWATGGVSIGIGKADTLKGDRPKDVSINNGGDAMVISDLEETDSDELHNRLATGVGETKLKVRSSRWSNIKVDLQDAISCFANKGIYQRSIFIAPDDYNIRRYGIESNGGCDIHDNSQVEVIIGDGGPMQSNIKLNLGSKNVYGVIKVDGMSVDDYTELQYKGMHGAKNKKQFDFIPLYSRMPTQLISKDLVERVRTTLTVRWNHAPFDPGGFDPKAKLADEFFSKVERMMREDQEFT